MIIEMARLRILGPRDRLGDVFEDLQFARRELGERRRRARRRMAGGGVGLHQARQRSDHLLGDDVVAASRRLERRHQFLRFRLRQWKP